MSTPTAAHSVSAMTALPPECARLNSRCPRAPSSMGLPFLPYENRTAAGEQPSRSASTRRSAIRRVLADRLGCSPAAVRFSYGRKGKRSEEHTSELQSHRDLVCRLLL